MQAEDAAAGQARERRRDWAMGAGRTGNVRAPMYVQDYSPIRLFRLNPFTAIFFLSDSFETQVVRPKQPAQPQRVKEGEPKKPWCAEKAARPMNGRPFRCAPQTPPYAQPDVSVSEMYFQTSHNEARRQRIYKYPRS